MRTGKEICEVRFNGDRIPVIREAGGHFVAMKPICDALGLTWRKQHRMITSDPVLGSTITVMVTVGHDGKQREMLCLPIEYLNGWLFKIPASRYQGKRREKIVHYQKECYRVLYEHFFGNSQKALPGGGTDPEVREMISAKLDQARKQGATGMARLMARLERSGMSRGFVSNLVRYRKMGLSQRETARLLDVSRRTLQEYEAMLRQCGYRFAPANPAGMQKDMLAEVC